ncbi:hypothetical protein ABZX98_16320 [Streptomyces sp. NPDC002992]|uniref:hypothetical protein n=1 Tax=Streptomyces sp. NPDC002992 TaxID=3154273 RepID=UPI0033AA7DBF
MSARFAMPWYARAAATVGRPVVLLAALAMSAPGEYQLARLAGWSPSVAWLMPVSVSVYAAVAAVIAATRPKGTAGRGSALVGAGVALALALAAQVVAHLISAGYVQSSAWLVAAVSAVPPVVVAHMLHLAAVPHASELEAMTALEDVGGQELADAEPEASTLGGRVAKLPVVDGLARRPQADTLPGLEPVAKVAKAPAKGGRSLEDIREAVAKLKADGQEVNGTTYAELVGVSARTARRDLEILAAAPLAVAA